MDYNIHVNINKTKCNDINFYQSKGDGVPPPPRPPFLNFLMGYVAAFTGSQPIPPPPLQLH